jgi:LPXTG-motif cell wall-anchored protein
VLKATTKRSTLRVAIALVTTVIVLALTLGAASAVSEPEVDATISIPTASDCATQSTGPFKLAISSDGTRLYATLNGDGRVAQLDTATGTVIATACTGARYPEGVAVSPDGTRIYVTNSAASTLRVLANADMSTVTDVNVGSAGNGVDVVTTPASVGKVYVYRHLEGSLVVINATDNTVTSTVNVGSSSTRRASGLARSPDGSTMYALVDAGVAVINTATDSVTTTIATTGATAIAVSPDGSFLYVVGGASNDSLIRIRTSDNTVVSTVSIGSNPTSVEITPDGLHAMVVLNSSNAAVFVDTATNTVTSTVTVGATPYGSVIAPSGLVAYVADWGGGFGDTLTQIALGWDPPPTSTPPTSESPTTEPPSTDPPITEPPSTEATVTNVNGSLPSTGANTQWFVFVAVALAGLGAALSFISRRRA